jgi:hypothetical protein
VAGFYERSNEPSGSVNGGDDQVRDYQLFNCSASVVDFFLPVKFGSRIRYWRSLLS